jgi:hypothetical protein
MSYLTATPNPVNGWAYLSVAQAIPTGSWTTVAFDLFDSLSRGMSLSANAIEIGYTGIYEVSAALAYDHSSNGVVRAMRLAIDSGGGFIDKEVISQARIAGPAGGAVDYMKLFTGFKYLFKGHKVKVEMFQDTGSNKNVLATQLNTNLKIRQVGYDSSLT